MHPSLTSLMLFGALTGAPSAKGHMRGAHYSHAGSCGHARQGILRQGLSRQLQTAPAAHPHAT
jgi:hypothetical protein